MSNSSKYREKANTVLDLATLNMDDPSDSPSFSGGDILNQNDDKGSAIFALISRTSREDVYATSLNGLTFIKPHMLHGTPLAKLAESDPY